MDRTQIRLDVLPFATGVCEEMDVDLVGAKLRAAVADFCQVERLSLMLSSRDAQNSEPAVAVAARKYIIGGGKLGASDQAEDGVYVLLPGFATPKLKLLSLRLEAGTRSNRCLLGSNPRQLNDTRTHNTVPSAPSRTRASTFLVKVPCIFSGFALGSRYSAKFVKRSVSPVSS
jgi:hypothetical protein